MCGITGIFSLQGVASHVDELKRATQIASYRGPDGLGFGFFETNQNGTSHVFNNNEFNSIGDLSSTNLGFGHRRLAIIDLSINGFQPMSNADKSLWITYNGEIYNYLELRTELSELGHVFTTDSDTEVILAAYGQWGEDCVAHLNGMWAFALADLKRGQLFCSRDRFGIKPFHYFYDGERFVFGSEIKQLLCFSCVPKEKNQRAVYEYLVYGAVDYGEETFFSSIHKLIQGQNLILNLADGTLKKRGYYSPELSRDHDISYLEAGTKFQERLIESIHLRLRSDVEVGTCLSGGLDSSSIVCLMHNELENIGKTEIQRTFSSHFEEEEANELDYMQEVIQVTKVEPHFVYPRESDLLDDLQKVVWHQDEPFGSTSIFAQWFVFKKANDVGIKVMLDGQGADEILAGYVGLYQYYFNQLRNHKRYGTLLYETLKYSHLHGESSIAIISKYLRSILGIGGNRFSQYKFVPNSNWVQGDFANYYHDQSQYLLTNEINPFDDRDQLENKLYQLTFINNLQTLLRHEDRNSMAHSVEARVPFLDHRLVEFIFSLPSKFKIRDGYTKRVLRDGMRNILPERIRLRVGKLGFATPEYKWQSTVLKPLIAEAINSEILASFIDQKKATVYYQDLMDSKVTDFSPWRWLNLYMWVEAYDLA